MNNNQQATTNQAYKQHTNVSSPNSVNSAQSTTTTTDSNNSNSNSNNNNKGIHPQQTSQQKSANTPLSQQQQQEMSHDGQKPSLVDSGDMDTTSNDILKQNMGGYDMNEQQLAMQLQNNPDLYNQLLSMRGFPQFMNQQQTQQPQQHVQFTNPNMMAQFASSNPNQQQQMIHSTSPNRHTPSLTQQNMRTPTPTEQARRASSAPNDNEDWSQDEINRLKEALQKYPIDMNSLDRNQCANISAIVRTKTPNEVANFLMHLQKQKLSNQQERTKGSMPTPQPRPVNLSQNPQTPQQQQQAQQAQQQQQQQQQMNQNLSAAQQSQQNRKRKNVGADANPKPTKVTKDGLPTQYTQPTVTTPQQLTQQTPQHMAINPSAAQMGHMYSQSSPPMHQQAPQLRTVQQQPPQTPQQQSQQESEEHVNRLLAENNKIIGAIRENITQHKVTNNIQMISKFRENIIQILTCMAKMSGVMSQMPPIPVKLNTICIPLQQVPTGTGQNQPQGMQAVQHAIPQQSYYQTGTPNTSQQMRP